MNYQCNHILLKGPRKGDICNKNAWFPFFFKCYCKQHALMYGVPITHKDTMDFCKQYKGLNMINN